MEKALVHLKKDAVLARVIEKYGVLQEVSEHQNVFRDIIDSIISQQLSVKASATIFKRFTALFAKGDAFTPEEILSISDEKIRECGISYPKIKYIKGISQAIVEGTVNFDEIRKMEDSTALTELIKLKGVGKWTAEMILMFTFARTDIFSMGDVGLRNAVAKLYRIDRDDFKKIEKISNKWKPYRTLACRYLWKSLDNEP